MKRGDLQRCPRIDDLRGSLTSVSPLEGGVEERIDDARREREDLWRDVRGEFPQELVRGLSLAPGIRALVVEVELVRGGLAEELGQAPEGFDIVELPLDQVVEGLHIGVIGRAVGRDAIMLHPVVLLHLAGEGGGGLLVPGPDVLGAIVGLEDDGLQRDAVLLEMLRHVGLEELAVGHRVLPAVGEEGRPGPDLPAGELMGWEPEPSHLWGQ